jgi:hypothetical protein
MSLVLLMLTLAQSATGQAWAFPVHHDHAFGSCDGALTISDDSIRYQARDGEHIWEWSYPEIASLEILSTSRIRIRSWESGGALSLWGDREFTFDVDETAADASEIDEEVYTFLDARSPRPVRTRIAFAAGNGSAGAGPLPAVIVQEVPVRHRHRLGGCQGMLSILGDRIVYETEDPEDSRTWRLADIESFGSTGEFDLRVSTAEETYRFDLKAPLNDETYRHLWENVYEPELRNYRETRR